MIEAIEYMHGKSVVHRDLKLENVLLDSKFNVKIADFGYTAYQNVNQLQAYRGTMSYMAPEIKEQKIYDGRQTDLFSLGVVIFIIVQGTFPFKEALPTEMYYSLLATGRTQEYFSTLKADHLSDNFKDLISKLFSYDGNVRYTAQEVKAHPWLAGFDKERTRQMLIDSAERRNQTKV
jgi:serine/threonine protein kinase